MLALCMVSMLSLQLGCDGGAKPKGNDASGGAGVASKSGANADSPAQAKASVGFETAVAETSAEAPDAVAAVTGAFVATYGGAEVEESELVEALDRFVGFVDQVTLSLIKRVDDMKPEETAKYETLGFVITKGEGRSGVRPDLARLGKPLAPALTANTTAYLHALGERSRLTLLEPSQTKPKDVVDLIVAFETLAGADEDTYRMPKIFAGVWAHRLLRLCEGRAAEGTPHCFVDEPLQQAYRAFVVDHAGSKYAPAVKAFLTKAEASEFRLSEDELKHAMDDVFTG